MRLFIAIEFDRKIINSLKQVQGSLKACGLGVYYLSNYSKKAYDECGESLAFMRYMDGGVVSFRVGMTKPDPRVYELFLREYGLDPAECGFVDDTPENVEAAEALGFQGICFTTYDQLIEKLNELGGLFHEGRAQ